MSDENEDEMDMAAAMAAEAAESEDEMDMAAAMEAEAAERQGGDANATIGDVIADDRLPAVHDVEVDIYAVLGQATMLVSQLLKVGRGAIIELDQRTTDPVEVQVNQQLVAKGEIVTVDDKLGVTITEIAKKKIG